MAKNGRLCEKVYSKMPNLREAEMSRHFEGTDEASARDELRRSKMGHGHFGTNLSRRHQREQVYYRILRVHYTLC